MAPDLNEIARLYRTALHGTDDQRALALGVILAMHLTAVDAESQMAFVLGAIRGPVAPVLTEVGR